MANRNRVFIALGIVFSSLSFTGCISDCEMVWGYSGGQPLGANFSYDAVEHYLNKSPECVNFKYKSGATPLHFASGSGRERIARLLISRGADVNARNDNHQTPLMLAAYNGRKELVQLLISGKMEIYPEIRAKDKSTYELIKSKYTKIIDHKKADVNAVDTYGMTALHHAALKGHLDIVKLLIANGAEVNAKDSNGCTPLYRAIVNNQSETSALLRKHAGNLGIEIFDAADQGDVEKMKSLLAKDRELVKARDPVQEQTPLYWAAGKGHKEVAEMLITYGTDVNHKNKWGFSALTHAAVQGHQDIVRLLCEHGATLGNEVCDAAILGNLDRVKILLSENAELINAKDVGYEWTPLHWAAVNGNKDTVEVLIEQGAKVNTKSKWGNTPLHCATYCGHRIIAEFLIANGADVHSRAYLKRTSLHWAVHEGHREVVELLIMKGADINAKDDRNHTALYYAEMLGHGDIANLLRKHGAKE